MANTRLSKDEILAEIQRIAAKPGGSAPGQNIFQKLTGIKSYHWMLHWSRWSDALVEAGFAPNSFGKAYPQNDLLRHLADLTRELRQFPVKGDLIRAHHNREDFPSSNVFYTGLGRKAEMCSQLYNWVQENADYSDILEYLPTQVESSPKSFKSRRVFKRTGKNAFSPTATSHLSLRVCLHWPERRTQSSLNVEGRG